MSDDIRCRNCRGPLGHRDPWRTDSPGYLVCVQCWDLMAVRARDELWLRRQESPVSAFALVVRALRRHEDMKKMREQEEWLRRQVVDLEFELGER